jgi:hypothetical protein
VAEAAPDLRELVRKGVLDGPLAALAWILVERGVPVLVAGGDDRVRGAILDALVAALPAARRPDATAPAEGMRLVRVAGTLATASPAGILRAALGATSGRSGLAACIDADDLGGVLAVLSRQGLSDDEASFLGIVLVLDRKADSGELGRLAAAHYLRPVVRDAGGHPRRLGPAVLATWDPGRREWEDFAWGVVPDLADRVQMRAGDLEAERDRRAALLAGRAHGGRVG